MNKLCLNFSRQRYLIQILRYLNTINKQANNIQTQFFYWHFKLKFGRNIKIFAQKRYLNPMDYH